MGSCGEDALGRAYRFQRAAASVGGVPTQHARGSDQRTGGRSRVLDGTCGRFHGPALPRRPDCQTWASTLFTTGWEPGDVTDLGDLAARRRATQCSGERGTARRPNAHRGYAAWCCAIR